METPEITALFLQDNIVATWRSVAALFLIFLVLDAQISFAIEHSSGRRNIPSRKSYERYSSTCSPVFEYFSQPTEDTPSRFNCHRCMKIPELRHFEGKYFQLQMAT